MSSHFSSIFSEVKMILSTTFHDGSSLYAIREGGRGGGGREEKRGRGREEGRGERGRGGRERKGRERRKGEGRRGRGGEGREDVSKEKRNIGWNEI